MKILIITQKVDAHDPTLGFFITWIQEFAKSFEKVTVICLEKGVYELPSNIEVLSLGKEQGASKPSYITKFYRYIWKYRKEYNAVFVHMNPEYIVLGGWLWQCMRKKVAMWYVHRQTHVMLRIALFFSNIVFTSSKETFGLRSSKVEYVGHGIDTSRFVLSPLPEQDPITIAYVGRISSIKKIDVFIRALALLRVKFPGRYRGRIIGSPVTIKDNLYETELKEFIQESNIGSEIILEPAIAQDALPEVYTTVSAIVNPSPKGGMDKVVLESLASGRPAFTSNQAFGEVFGKNASIFVFPEDDHRILAEKVDHFFQLSDKKVIVKILAQKIRSTYSLEALIRSISLRYQSK